VLAAVQPEILDGAVQPIVDSRESMDGVVNIEDSRPLPGIGPVRLRLGRLR